MCDVVKIYVKNIPNTSKFIQMFDEFYDEYQTCDFQFTKMFVNSFVLYDGISVDEETLHMINNIVSASNIERENIGCIYIWNNGGINVEGGLPEVLYISVALHDIYANMSPTCDKQICANVFLSLIPSLFEIDENDDNYFQ